VNGAGIEGRELAGAAPHAAILNVLRRKVKKSL